MPERVIVITGATDGLGRALSESLANDRDETLVLPPEPSLARRRSYSESSSSRGVDQSDGGVVRRTVRR
jgi:NAD(P)-dependent dehydrogenase (short-subunit alcohol dehydrogenase family)